MHRIDFSTYRSDSDSILSIFSRDDREQIRIAIEQTQRLGHHDSASGLTQLPEDHRLRELVVGVDHEYVMGWVIGQVAEPRYTYRAYAAYHQLTTEVRPDQRDIAIDRAIERYDKEHQ